MGLLVTYIIHWECHSIQDLLEVPQGCGFNQCVSLALYLSLPQSLVFNPFYSWSHLHCKASVSSSELEERVLLHPCFRFVHPELRQIRIGASWRWITGWDFALFLLHENIAFPFSFRERERKRYSQRKLRHSVQLARLDKKFSMLDLFFFYKKSHMWAEK